MFAFTITALSIFLILAFIWSRKTWPNIIMKMVFYGMAGWAAFLVFQAAGYVVKT